MYSNSSTVSETGLFSDKEFETLELPEVMAELSLILLVSVIERLLSLLDVKFPNIS